MTCKTPSLFIDQQTVLDEGAQTLAQIDPVMARLLAEGIIPPMRSMEAGFSGLCRIITGQQLSTASANAIWNRFSDHLGVITPTALIKQSDETLRNLGMSKGKIKTLRAVCDAVISGRLPIETLPEKPAAEAHALMTAIHGIGPWTAEIYLMFCIGHADIFPVGDLALQEAVKIAYQLETRPSAKQLSDFAAQWCPWRSVSARILWAYYRKIKSKDGLIA